MKSLFCLLLLVGTTFCAYLDGLNRSFDQASGIIDFYFTLTNNEINDLLRLTQISQQQTANGAAKNLEDFETKNAKLVIKMNGQSQTFEEVTFKTGGMYARSFEKVGYNFKLKDKFLGRKQLRLRPDTNDLTYMRSKLSCDIANRAGLPSIQATYARLYMNNEFWGLYILMDAVKTSWVKANFNVSSKEVTTLYQCKYDGMDLSLGSDRLCINANDDVPDMSAFQNFISQVNSARSASDLDKIMDVDVFLKYMAFEWLIGSFDNFLVLGHNFYFYQRESDNKWVIIEYDFDNTYGTGLQFPSYWMSKGLWNMDVKKASFKDWELNRGIIKILVHNDDTRFKKVLRELLVSAYNPTILNDHIAQLKSFLKPYVVEDTTKTANGSLPGRINKIGSKTNQNVNDFERNIEGNTNNTEGVKSWISAKFNTACSQYNFNASEIESEARSYVAKGYDYGKTSSSGSTTQTGNIPQPTDSSCWSQRLGYSCCNGCSVIYTDNDGKWGVENGQWCGIGSNCNSAISNECFTQATGQYPCCSTCNVQFVDKDGRWGYENDQWCGINYNC